MMHDVMTGMFWGGVVMALPPVAISIALAIYIYRHRRSPAEQPGDRTPKDD